MDLKFNCLCRLQRVQILTHFSRFAFFTFKNKFELFTVLLHMYSLRSVKVQQRTLNDNASTLIDMAKVSNTI